nr:MAG TPA: hypothetical protein [Caudoviricetes sp.]
MLSSVTLSLGLGLYVSSVADVLHQNASMRSLCCGQIISNKMCQNRSRWC